MKTKTNVLVIGSGSAGLGAASWLTHRGIDFMVVEGSDKLPLNLHNGVHYLHSIPELPFNTDLKEITLTDGILVNGEIIHTPNLLYSLQYSEKVREVQHPSSIMEIGKRTKVYMPKSNTLNSLLQECYEYAGAENFNFGYWLQGIDTEKKSACFKRDKGFYYVDYEHLISAVPLDKFREMTGNKFIKSLKLECTPVYITNYKVNKIVPNWMINLYIPDYNNPIYRASILNGICSVESIRELTSEEIKEVKYSLKMFHFSTDPPEKFTWSTGKVKSITMDERARMIEELAKLSIYPAGRFAMWNRQLLVDSTINQVAEIIKSKI